MTTPLTNYLDSVEKRAEAATAGPWAGSAATAWPDIFSGIVEQNHEKAVVPVIAHVIYQPDLSFIAHARTDIPRLISMVREAVGALEDMCRIGDPNGPMCDNDGRDCAACMVAERTLARLAAIAEKGD